jgi:Icc-related predicted phosphoesterase
MDIVKRLQVFHQSIGCKELAKRVKTLQPKLHVFGHVHDSTGIIESDGKLSVNGAQELGKEKGLKNRPFLFEIDL